MSSKRSAEEMERRKKLAERVETDPSLTPEEKETNILFTTKSEPARISSAKPTVVKRLLRHDYVEIRSLHGATDSERNVCSNVTLEQSDELEKVYFVSARIPVGCLTVKGKPRQSNAPSSVVNTPSMVQRVEETFNNNDA